jgi:hypothetical protein
MSIPLWLVVCGDHKLSPGVVVCRHLLDGESREWCPVAIEGEECYDWICPECRKKYPVGTDFGDFDAVCLYCVRELQKTATLIHEVPDPE